MNPPKLNVSSDDSPAAPILAEAAAAAPSPPRPEATMKTRLRIRFTKSGDLRWISHRDLARVWERLLRRAGLQLAFSQGFHPKPKISFPSALALGIEALDEIIELEILGAFELSAIDQLLRREMPAGMELLQLQALETALGKAQVLGASYRIPHSLTTAAGVAELQQRLDGMLQQPLLQLERDGKTVACETADANFGLKIEGEYFLFSLPKLAEGSIRPSELLTHVGLGQLLEEGWTLQRTAVHLCEPIERPDKS